MNIDQLKTVLELNRTHHFKKTADTLFVSQSTVSARLNSLEQELGCKLFTRTSRSVELTPAGQRFLGHAQSIMAVWRRAQQEAASHDHQAPMLAVGGLFILWDIILLDWLERLHQHFPNLNLVAESHDHAFLIRQLLDGALDLIFLFEPPSLAELIVSKTVTIPLILVSSEYGQDCDNAINKDYIMVDWGEDFLLEHTRLFSEYHTATRRVNQSRLALKLMLSDGGSAYLAEQVVTPFIQNHRLHKVADAPLLERQIFAVYLRESSNVQFINQSLLFI
jgi:DNA-binding transcriptional LysR family regulator